MYIDVSLDRADEDTGLSKRRKLLYLTWKLFARRTYPSPHGYDVMHGTINSKQH